jgi:ATP-binding cassette subfamily C protein LapB
MTLRIQVRELFESLAPARLTRVLKGPAVILFLAGLATNIVTILTSLFTLLVYDKVYPHDGVATLVALTIGTLALMAIDAGFRVYRTKLINLALFSQGQTKTLDYFRNKFRLFGSNQKKQLSYLEKTIHDLTAIQSADVRTATLMVELPFILVLLGSIALIAGELVWVPLIAITALLVVTGLTMEKAKNASQQVDADKREAIQMLAHSARGADWFFGMGAWPWLQSVDSKLSNKLKTSTASLASINQIRQLATQVISQLISIAIVFFGFFMFRDGTLSFGAVIATYILSTRCLAPLSNLTQIPSSREMESETESVEREVGKYSIPTSSTDFKLEIKDLSFTYAGRTKPALKLFDLTIKAGEKIAIVGRSGSGKTTLAKLLVQALGHPGGEIKFMGLPLSQIDPAQWEKFCMYVPQTPWFGEGSALDQIRLGRTDVTDVELAEIVDKLGLHDLFSGRMADGQGEGLSTGQIQLLGLMRCLIRSAPIVILDEPTNSLDHEAEERVMNAIFQKFSDATILLITHKKTLADRMDRVLVFEGGELVRDVGLNK